MARNTLPVAGRASTRRGEGPCSGTLARWRAAGVAAWLLAGCAAPEGTVGAIHRLEGEARRRPRSPEVRLDLAANYAVQGDSFAAIEQLEAARRLGRQEERLSLRLAELYTAIGDRVSAAGVLRACRQAAPASEALRSALAQACMAQGDFAGAAAAYRTLDFTAAPAARQRAARQHLLAGDPEAAARWLSLGEPTDPEWKALCGLAELERGRPARAVRWLQDAAAAALRDPWYRYMLGLAQLRAGDRDRARDTWAAAARLPEPPTAALTGAARLLAASGRVSEAAGLLNQAPAEALDHPEYWETAALLAQRRSDATGAALARGRSQRAAGDPWTAETSWRRALPSGGGEPAKALLRALVESEEGRFDGAAALRDALAGVTRWPRDPFFLRRAAELLLEQNRYTEARALAERLRRAGGRERAAAAADLQARIALEAGDGAVLREAAARSLALEPQAAAAHLLLAESLRQGDAAGRREAETHLRAAVRAAPRDAEALAELGSLLAEQGNAAEAVTHLRAALAAAPTVLDGVPHVQLARLYRREGRTLEAELHEERYRRLRRLKDDWAALLPALRRPAPAVEYRRLGEIAVARGERSIALAAWRRAARLAPRDPAAWRGVAAAERLYGRFDAALDAMLRSRAEERQGNPA